MYQEKKLKAHKGYEIWEVVDNNVIDYCVCENGEVINVYKSLAEAYEYFKLIINW